MSTQTLIHIGLEVIVISGVTFYFTRKVGAVEAKVDDVAASSKKIEEVVTALANLVNQQSAEISSLKQYIYGSGGQGYSQMPQQGYQQQMPQQGYPPRQMPQQGYPQMPQQGYPPQHMQYPQQGYPPQQMPQYGQPTGQPMGQPMPFVGPGGMYQSPNMQQRPPQGHPHSHQQGHPQQRPHQGHPQQEESDASNLDALLDDALSSIEEPTPPKQVRQESAEILELEIDDNGGEDTCPIGGGGGKHCQKQPSGKKKQPVRNRSSKGKARSE